MHTSRLALAVTAVVVLVVACASTGSPTPYVGDAGLGVSVAVENEHTRTLEIYAFRDGDMARLGTVQPLQSRVFHIPERLLSQEPYSIRILARPGRAGGYSTPTFSLKRGERILLRVEERLNQSSFSIVAMY